MEIRIHGRGGQGGVTCAKILAAVHARMGFSVQAFGDYASERSGAPVRAYTRVSREPITNRNKVYRPDHLLVLDPTLLGDEVVSGLSPGGILLLNTPDAPEALPELARPFQRWVVDATEIARRHRIGTRTVVIVNTTIAGAFLKALGLDLTVLEEVYRDLGLLSNLPAAQEAFAATRHAAPDTSSVSRAAPAAAAAAVLPLTEHTESPPTPLKTGSWRNQTPHFMKKPAPCSAFCPAGNDVIGFIQALVREG